MTKPPKYWNKAKKYLSKKDKVMKDLIYKYRDKTLTTRKDIFFFMQKYNWSADKCCCCKLSF